MKDIRPYIADKLKEMRATNQSVWISFNGKRYKIAPVNPWLIGHEDDLLLQAGGWFLTKGKRGYYVSWVRERQGRAYVSKNPGGVASYMNLDNVLARIEETHADPNAH